MKNNSSFPHPVLGVNQGVKPDLGDDALRITDIKDSGDSYVYVFTLKQENENITQKIRDDKAEYICEIDCIKTFYKRTVKSKNPQIEVKIKKKDVVGHVDFYFYVVTTCQYLNYTNDFNDDYLDPENGQKPSFKLDTGAVLVFFGRYSDDVNLRFSNKPELQSFVQVVKRQDSEKNVDIDLTDDRINIELPDAMFTDFVTYNQSQYRGIFYTSLICNALVKGILNINKKEESIWADSIKSIIENSPEKYRGLDLEDPADAVDIAIKMLSSDEYGSPYDLLFDCINKL